MSHAERNAALIRTKTKLKPAIGIVLGSGLGEFVKSVEGGVTIPYGELQGFPVLSVSGHAGSLVIGRIGEVAVAVMAGRGHYYEHGRPNVMHGALETLKALGVRDLILTNAAGSLREDFPPASVMLITDHINLISQNPLVGEQSEARFVDLSEAYDRQLRRAAINAADAEGVELHQGVYMWFSGPSFETPAEIRAARILGADAIGMSTVPEVIIARFLGMRLLAFSIITNYAAGMTDNALTHTETKEVAPRGGKKLERVVKRALSAWPKQKRGNAR